MSVHPLRPIVSTIASVKSLRKICKQAVFCLTLACLCSGHLLYALPAATATALQLSSGDAVGNGIAVTLTATVTSTATGKPVSPGFVTFCDASAKYCEDLAVLGSTAVNSSGVATMKKVLPPGTHKISAFFNPTVSNGKSISSIQTVDVPVQVKAVPVPVITKIGTSNPLPVQASVSVVGRSPLSGTLSIVQTQNKQALVTMPVGASTAQYGFAPFAATPVGYTSSGASVAGDFNGDGLLDLVSVAVSGFSEGALYYLPISLNDPTHPGQFVPGQQLYGGDGDQVIVGDFNNDGVLDLVAQNPFYEGDTNPQSYGIFFGDPAHPGQFLSGNDAVIFYSDARFQSAADINQDGVLDLIGTSQSGDLDIFFGDPAHPGNFIDETTIPVATAVDFVADVNGDGVPDVVGVNYVYPDPAVVTVVLGDAVHPGHFLAPVSYPLTIANYRLATFIGDFNQDGHPDVAVLFAGNNLTGNLNLLLSNPNAPGQFLAAENYPLASSNRIALGDFNGDGALDIAQIGGDGPGIAIFPGDPDGSGKFLSARNYPFILPQTPGSSTGIDSLTVADFNGDGLSDMNLSLSTSYDDGGYSSSSPANPLLTQQTQTATVSFPSVTYDATKSPLAQALYSGDDNYGMIGSCDIDLSGNKAAPKLYDIHADANDVDATVLWYWTGDVGAVDYGTTTALGSTTDWQRAAPSHVGGPSYIRLSGLKPATKYYYRIRAIGYFSGCSHWTTTSPMETFTTAP